MAHRFYSTKRWKRLRAHQLRAQPFCQCPHHKGEYVEANVVDHIEPHKGNAQLFFDPRNLQSMAKRCHDSWKQRMERGGQGNACDEHGEPLDKTHDWYR